MFINKLWSKIVDKVISIIIINVHIRTSSQYVGRQAQFKVDLRDQIKLIHDKISPDNKI